MANCYTLTAEKTIPNITFKLATVVPRKHKLVLKATIINKGPKRLVSVNIYLVEGNSAAIFVSKVSPGILVIKEK